MTVCAIVDNQTTVSILPMLSWFWSPTLRIDPSCFQLDILRAERVTTGHFEDITFYLEVSSGVRLPRREPGHKAARREAHIPGRYFALSSVWF